MDQLVMFFETNGIAVTLIALFGIVILGILKYFNLFDKYSEKTRHYLYLIISIGLTLAGVLILELAKEEFDPTTFFSIATMTYSLNQTFYNLFKITPVNRLAGELLAMVLELFGFGREDFEDDSEVEPEDLPPEELEAINEEIEKELEKELEKQEEQLLEDLREANEEVQEEVAPVVEILTEEAAKDAD